MILRAEIVAYRSNTEVVPSSTFLHSAFFYRLNAVPPPLPKAEAQRTLEAVGCRRLFGKVLASCAPAHSVPHNTYGITSSARRSSDGGIVIPSALAVLRLITSSNFVGWVTGMRRAWRP